MKRFKNILYLAHGNAEVEGALARAVGLARANGARLTLLDVMEDLSESPLRRWLGGEEVQTLGAEERIAQLARLAEPLRGEVSLDVRVRWGRPFMETIRTVLEGRHDLLVMPSEGRRPLASRLFGSTDLHLLRKCPCPVWVHAQGHQGGYGRVLAAVDTSPDAPENLARLVLDLATSQARREGAELHVVHAWRLEGESLLRSGRARLPGPEVDRLLEGVRREHAARLEALLAAYPGHEAFHVHLVKAHADRAIIDTAAAQRADLLVMGTVGRTGVPGLFIGNTAEGVLGEVKCSVLAVKPAGFVSPVRLD
jgi:universal stress protein E